MSREDLDWLAEVLWPDLGGAVVTTFDEPLPEGYELAEQYHVFPSEESPLLLYSAGPAASGVKSLGSRLLLQSRGRQLTKVAAAASLCAPTALVQRPRLLSVGVLPGTRTSAGSPLLLDAVSAVLGVPVRANLLVSEPNPNRKPTLEVFDDRGRALGFMKVGWSDATRALVRNEVHTLSALSRASGSLLPRRPRLLFSTRWNALELSMTEPVPPWARKWPDERLPDVAVSTAVATALAPPVRVPIRDLPLWGRCAAALDQVDDPSLTWAAGLLRQRLEEARRAAAEEEVLVAGSHGDWSSWNMATDRRQMWAWDWEHATTGVPMAFDVVHYVFQLGTAVHGVSTEQAVAQVLRRCREPLDRLGVSPSATRSIVTAYLVTMWLRMWGQHRYGAPWDPSIHPGIVEALSEAALPEGW